jgi:hypothetical protein
MIIVQVLGQIQLVFSFVVIGFLLPVASAADVKPNIILVFIDDK